MSRAAWCNRETLDGHVMPRHPRPGDRCGYCGVEDGNGSWLLPDGDRGWLCEDCQ